MNFFEWIPGERKKRDTENKNHFSLSNALRHRKQRRWEANRLSHEVQWNFSRNFDSRNVTAMQRHLSTGRISKKNHSYTTFDFFLIFFLVTDQRKYLFALRRRERRWKSNLIRSVTSKTEKKKAFSFCSLKKGDRISRSSNRARMSNKKMKKKKKQGEDEETKRRGMKMNTKGSFYIFGSRVVLERLQSDAKLTVEITMHQEYLLHLLCRTKT